MIFCSSLLTAQIDRVYEPELVKSDVDTLTELDTLINKNGFFSLFKGKPGRAALYSLVLPGGGQLYNKKWLKVPIAWAIEGFTVYNIIESSRQYNLAQNEYLRLLKEGGNVARAKAVRDIYRTRREYSWVYFGIGKLITIIDAYVDRHFMGFDVSDDLSLLPYSELNGYNISNGISLTISLNKPEKSKEAVSMFP
ncbi:MAG: hypothetical protein IPM42_19150 [Saprospiraceae bacterium]|nr:hypothetical protein [Saprospiraceae bacterium]